MSPFFRRASGARSLVRSLALPLAATVSLCASTIGCRSKGNAVVDAGPIAAASASSPRPNASITEPDHVPEDPSKPRGKVTGEPEVAPDDTKKSFVANRLTKARAGVVEIVGMRVWHCGPSCTCPPPCIETVSEETGLTWIDLRDDGGEAVSLADWASAEVTGRFTGQTRSVPALGGDGPPILLPEVRLTSTPTVVGTAMAPESEGAHAKVLLEGALAKKLVPKVKDDKPFLVIAGAFPLLESTHSTQADDDAASALFQKLDKLGIHDAERYDSRAFTGLACCFDVVLGGRFADAKNADARVKQLAGRGVKAYTKRGF